MIAPSMRELMETPMQRRERSSGVLKKRVRSGENCGKKRGLGIARLNG